MEMYRGWAREKDCRRNSSCREGEPIVRMRCEGTFLGETRMSGTHQSEEAPKGKQDTGSGLGSRSVLLGVASFGVFFGCVLFLALSFWPSKRPDNGRQTGPASSGDATLSRAAEEKLDRALRNEQLVVAKALVEEFPENQNAWYLLGLVYKEQGNTQEAVSSWRRSLELGRSSAEIHRDLGQAALLEEDFETAARCFQKALELDPRDTGSREGLARTLMYEGKMEQAIGELREAGDLTAEGHRMIAEAYQQLEDFEHARESYEAALEADPDLAEAHYGLARTCARLGRQEESRSHMERFQELKARSERVGRHWRKEFEPLQVTQESVAHTHTDVGRVYLAGGNAQRAAELWRKAAGLDPGNTAPRLQLALLHARSNRLEEALRLYEEVRSIDPEDPLVHYNLGNVHLRMEKPEAAERDFRKVIALAPERPDGYRALAALYLREGRNLQEAESLALEAIERKPDAVAWATLARIRERTGNPEGAREAIQEASRLEPGNTMHRSYLEQLDARK